MFQRGVKILISQMDAPSPSASLRSDGHAFSHACRFSLKSNKHTRTEVICRQNSNVCKIHVSKEDVNVFKKNNYSIEKFGPKSLQERLQSQNGATNDQPN